MAYVSLGVGVAGVVAGAVGGLVTMSAKNTADTNCPVAGCNSTGTDAESRGKTWSTVGTLGFVVGGAALAAGITLLLVKPSPSSAVVAHVSPAGGEVGWAASF